MAGLLHEEPGLEDGVAVHGGDDLGILGGQSGELPHGGPVLIVDLDGVLQGGVGDLHPGDALQLLLQNGVLPLQEAVGRLQAPVLGVGEDQHGGGALPLLGHALEGVAGDGEDHGGQIVIGPLALQLHDLLHNGAGEGGQIGPGLGHRAAAAPEAHREETGGVDQLLGSVDGHHADGALARLGQVVGHGLSGIAGNGSELLQQGFDVLFHDYRSFLMPGRRRRPAPSSRPGPGPGCRTGREQSSGGRSDRRRS